MDQTQHHEELKLYDEEGDTLLNAEQTLDKVTLLPQRTQVSDTHGRIRIMWGQDMLRDLLDSRYRAVVCGVNDEDNSHGIVAQLVDLTEASQWTAKTVTSYARLFHESVSVHAAADREPYILKFDLDSLLIFGLLRPRGADHFTPAHLSQGFKTVVKMLSGRRERLPVASVSFLGARSNRLVDPKTGAEPSFETALRIMYESGFRGDVYPSPSMWQRGNVGVFASYPFPPSLDTMRSGGS